MMVEGWGRLLPWWKISLTHPVAAHCSKHLHFLKVPVELHAKQWQPMLLLQGGDTRGITVQEGRIVPCINSFVLYPLIIDIKIAHFIQHKNMPMSPGPPSPRACWKHHSNSHRTELQNCLWPRDHTDKNYQWRHGRGKNPLWLCDLYGVE